MRSEGTPPQGLSDVGPDFPLWTFKELLLAITAFIRATATNYPPTIFPSLPPSLASMVFPASAKIIIWVLSVP